MERREKKWEKNEQKKKRGKKHTSFSSFLTYQNRLLLARPRVLVDVRRQLVVPTLAQLLADAPRKVVDEPRPAPLAVRRDQRFQLGVFFFRPLPFHLGDGVAAAAAAVGRCCGGLGELRVLE